ncbi:hypothetical protein OEZ86_013330 [Tetradesmus obliquus]|nr:hypothetical protein OEZ86_013330 [Tetradesmus obliquus]
MWPLLLLALSLCRGTGGNAVQARQLRQSSGLAACKGPAFEWPPESGYCWTTSSSSSSSSLQQQVAPGITGAAVQPADAEAGQLKVIVKMGKQASAAAAVQLENSMGYGDYVWRIDSSAAVASANLVAVAFVHAGTTRRFNVSFSPYSQQQQQQQQQGTAAAASAAAAAQSVQRLVQPLQLSSQQPADLASRTGHITQRLRWSDGDEMDPAPHSHFESYSDDGLLLATWKVQKSAPHALPFTHPGPNVFSSSNVAVANGQLSLRVVKSGKGKSAKSSSAEVALDRSLGHGTYVFEIDSNPSLLHQNLVGAALILQDDQRDFKVAEMSRWGVPDIPNTQYVVQPYQTNPPHRFNVSQARVSHRLRWSGSSDPSQLAFDSWAADSGALLQSWTGTGGNNFAPGTERVKLNFWLMKDAADLPARSTLAFNCFRFCPLGQEAACSTAAGTPTCRGTLPPPTQPPSSPPSPPSPSPPPPNPPNPPDPEPPQPCADWQFMWPANSGHCWYRRDSNGEKQGPGDNLFSSANAGVNAETGYLVLKIVKEPGGGWSCGEVFMDHSLGPGDYTFVVQSDPSLMHHNLVASPFLYAANAPDGSSRELDVVEFGRWGQPINANSQYVVQPWNTNPPHVFNVSGVGHTHRMRWSGGSSPQQVQFESFSADGRLIQSWTNTGGDNFVPGPEAVHINHWIFAQSANLPASSSFVVSCFKFCPLGQEAACSAPLGTRPSC